ncbi:unnamed protein product [Didymodactylos carnosus]|uniref:CCHC-type domain-containing protein n=1 Tax=Didymodactylos carnosus TaxID=1234261 RepID=A0A815A9W1_9BILA|nr:unnamed protein product [Didymodactylos carnosus]CAF1280120.1 unnamed protein product [Didymodactylos carnosus]CAF4026008.1 unnamed protein product [Didymodactylos carnosus]CAF4084994.1 unnamed protein product [Didymodactylos carnosus]
MSSSKDNNTAAEAPSTSVIIHGIKLEDDDLSNVQKQIGHQYVGILSVRAMYNTQKQIMNTLLAEFKSCAVVKEILNNGFISIAGHKYRVENPNSSEKKAQPQKRASRPVMTCFKCQQPGHKVSQCPELRKQQYEYDEEQYYNRSRNSSHTTDHAEQKFEVVSIVDKVWPPLSTVQASRTSVTQPLVVHTSTTTAPVSKAGTSTAKSVTLPADLLKATETREVNMLNSFESKLLQMEVKLREQDQRIQELQLAVSTTIIPAFDELKTIINKYNANYVQMKQELSDVISRATTAGNLKTLNNFVNLVK